MFKYLSHPIRINKKEAEMTSKDDNEGKNELDDLDDYEDSDDDDDNIEVAN